MYYPYYQALSEHNRRVHARTYEVLDPLPDEKVPGVSKAEFGKALCRTTCKTCDGTGINPQFGLSGNLIVSPCDCARCRKTGLVYIPQ